MQILDAAGLDDEEGLVMRVVVAGMGSLEEVRDEWSLDDLTAAHRALWLKEQMTDLKIKRFIEAIGKGLKGAAKKR
jgi:hypothetical protein